MVTNVFEQDSAAFVSRSTFFSAHLLEFPCHPVDPTPFIMNFCLIDIRSCWYYRVVMSSHHPHHPSSYYRSFNCLSFIFQKLMIVVLIFGVICKQIASLSEKDGNCRVAQKVPPLLKGKRVRKVRKVIDFQKNNLLKKVRDFRDFFAFPYF